MNCYNKNYIQNKGKTMKFYRVCVMSLILMGTYLQADVTTKEPVCKSIVECDKLSHSIEAQIDVLEKKGIENLTDEEFEKLDLLQDKLLAAQRAKSARQSEIIAEEKAKSARQSEIIAEKKATIAKMLKEQNKQLNEVGTFLK